MFKEKKHAVFFVDLRIAIQGAEVTSFLVEGVQVTYSDRNAPNTVTFTLHNAENVFTLTDRNLKYNKWQIKGIGRHQEQYSELAKRIMYEYKMANNLKDKTGASMWEYKAGDCILGKNDPVRIFQHNPEKEANFNSSKLEEEWFPLFTGWIDSHTIITNRVNGHSIIKIVASCVKSQLKKMRLSFTPIVQFEKEMTNQLVFNTSTTSFFKDMIWGDTQSYFQDPRANLPFLDSMRILFFGDIEPKLNRPGSKSRLGFFEMGHEIRGNHPNYLKSYSWDHYIYKEDKISEIEEDTDKEEARNSVFYIRKESPETINLDDYNNLVITSRPKSFERKGDYFYNGEEVEKIIKETTTWGEESPWRASINFLLPYKESGFDQLIDQTIVQARETREWTSRYDCIMQILNICDYQLIVNGYGDMFFEYPMYDFIPDDFPYYPDLYKIDKFAKDDKIDLESGNITTGLIVTPGLETLIGSGAESNIEVKGYFNKVVVKSDILCGKYGVSLAAYEAPLGKEAKRGVELPQLQLYALIEFSKRLSNINKITTNFAYHPYLFPNRNLQYGYVYKCTKDENESNIDDDCSIKPNIIAMIRSITIDIKLFSKITMSADLIYPKTYYFDEDNKIQTKYFYGGERMPINFREPEETIDNILSKLKGVEVAYIDKNGFLINEAQLEESNFEKELNNIYNSGAQK